MRSRLVVLVAIFAAGCGRPGDPDSSPGLALFFFVSAGVAALGAFQERKDAMRCVGFILFTGLLLLLGFASVGSNRLRPAPKSGEPDARAPALKDAK